MCALHKAQIDKKNSEGIDDPYVWTKEKAYKEIKKLKRNRKGEMTKTHTHTEEGNTVALAK